MENTLSSLYLTDQITILLTVLSLILLTRLKNMITTISTHYHRNLTKNEPHTTENKDNENKLIIDNQKYNSCTSTSSDRGFLLCLEGIDNSGKTEQFQQLQKYLQQKHWKTSIIEFPNTKFAPHTGKILRSFLQKQAFMNKETASILFAANRWETAKTIIDRINNGEIIILDRYCYSGTAYSMATGNSKSWSENLNTGLPQPDIITELPHLQYLTVSTVFWKFYSIYSILRHCTVNLQ